MMLEKIIYNTNDKMGSILNVCDFSVLMGKPFWTVRYFKH